VLGGDLFEGFPENDAGIRDLIDRAVRFFSALPVGADLDEVIAEFITWI
jgi:hypothetical protein